MLQEKVTGKALLQVKDRESGLDLNCYGSYSTVCMLQVVDEKTYAWAEGKQPIGERITELVNSVFMIACAKAYPDGIELDELPKSGQIIGDSIKENIQPMLETLGLSADLVLVEKIELEEAEKKQFLLGRERKARMSNPFAGLTPEQIAMVQAALQGNNQAAQAAGAEQTAPKAPAGEWICSCGAKNTGKFCMECGAKRPDDEWICSCGSKNKTKFCPQCGAKRP